MALRDSVIELLRVRSFDDDQLAAQLRVVRQQVNQLCRAMQYEGLLTRTRGPAGKIVNQLTAACAAPPTPRTRASAPPAPGDPLTEDDVRDAIADWLRTQGFEVTVAWGHDPGIDIEGQRGADRWVIEAKGSGGYDQMSRNYFTSVIGSLLQRMTDAEAHYALALPDVRPFVNLVARFPEPARACGS